MKVDVVADVGNTRVKWGRCESGRVAEMASLPPDNLDAWQRQLADWKPKRALRWVVSGVHPERLEQLTTWLRRRGDTVRVLDRANHLPLRVKLDQPDKVGIDRLLNAVAANRGRELGQPAVIVDAGSAVTVDWVDEVGGFRGGSIFPGLRLMARALHDYTALLPKVEINRPTPATPGLSTVDAVMSGIYWAVAGGIKALIVAMARASDRDPWIFLTGGDAALLLPALVTQVIFWPEMTLEGVRITGEALP